jgi:hypothetical protein
MMARLVDLNKISYIRLFEKNSQLQQCYKQESNSTKLVFKYIEHTETEREKKKLTKKHFFEIVSEHHLFHHNTNQPTNKQSKQATTDRHIEYKEFSESFKVKNSSYL